MATKVAVVGLGAMGSAALWRLAERGASVIGFEQYFAGHSLGSSHGESRIIRQAYFEDPAYVPLVLESYGLWHDLEQRSGRRLLIQTGGLMVGGSQSEVVSGALRSAVMHGLRHTVLERADLRRRFPQFSVPDDAVGVHEPDAGALLPELCVQTQIDAARTAGAEVRLGTRVLQVEQVAEGVRVVTGDGDVVVDRAVIAGGAWNEELITGLDLPLAVERQVVAWFRPGDVRPFAPGVFPVFLLEIPSGQQYYGFPSLDGGTVKVARHHGGDVSHAHTIDRTVHDEDLAIIRSLAHEAFPGLGGDIVNASVCMYTNTPDEHFAIGVHPGMERIVVLAGFSGHGFKFSPAVGDVAADLVLDGTSRRDLRLFDPGRFH